VRLACALLGALGAATAHGAEFDTLIRHATVVDVVAGRIVEEQDIAIRSGRIEVIAASRDAAAWRARETVDARGRFAIPGLTDMHVHFGGGDALIEENRNLLPLYVAHGVTAVRDAAGDLSPSVFAWRDAVQAGTLVGPRIFTSGPKIEGRGSIWPGDTEVGDRGELLAALDQLAAWHVDFVKLTDDQLSPELFLFGVAEAARRGLRTSAHIPPGVTIDEASAAGLGSIEHLGYAIQGGAPREQEIASDFRGGKLTRAQLRDAFEEGFDPAVARATYARLAARGTAITPTLNGSRVIAYLDEDDHANDPYLKYIGPGLRATYDWRVQRAAKDDADAIRRRHARFEHMAALLPLVSQAGVTVLAGTDAGFLNSFDYPGIGLHDELALLVRYGLTPLEALRAATLNGAKFLGHADDSGSLAAGKRADIVLLRADPLADIGATRQIDVVVLAGRVLHQRDLDDLLAEAAARVRRQSQAVQPAIPVR
jgi:imidazolonepropionase-like amidohydrolase